MTSPDPSIVAHPRRDKERRPHRARHPGAMMGDSQWTLETLRIYLESLIAALDRQLEDRQHSHQQFLDQATQFITRNEADAVHNRLGNDLSEMWTAIRLCIPRAEYDAAHTRLVEQIVEMSHRVDKQEGRTAGIGTGWGYLIAAIATISAIVSIYAVINHL